MMCDYISENAILSVPENRLDEVPLAHVQSMVSENVLVHDGHRYALFHESFFHYVFARRFDARDGNLVDLLLTQGQQLFRRAQVRQILAFQRERNWASCLQTLRRLLADSSIRLHIKQVVIAWLASLDEPRQDEWEILKPLLLDEGEPFGWGIWRPWYRSAPWFRLLDQKGVIEHWMSSDDDHPINHAMTMIANVQKHEWDRVAELLDSRVGLSEQWNTALRRVVNRATGDASESYFTFIGRLVDEGLFIESINSWDADLWSLIYHLKQNAVSSCYLLRRFLTRQLEDERARSTSPLGFANTRIRNRGSHDVRIMQELATNAPREIVEAVLPYVIGVAQAYIEIGETSLHRDRYWEVLYRDDEEFVPSYDRGPIVKVLASAVARLVENSPDVFETIIDQLRSSDLRVAHLILVRALTECAPAYAKWSANYLRERPELLEFGYADARYWAARDLIRSIAPALDDSDIGLLEESILAFSTPSERGPGMGRTYGCGQWTLLSALPRDRLTSAGHRRLGELIRKFGPEPAPPVSLRELRTARSPIPLDSAARMSDDAWLRAMMTFSSRSDRLTAGDYIGSAHELSQVLGERARSEPERFARLALRMEDDFDPSFFVAILGGISRGEISDELLSDVVARCHSLAGYPCSMAISSLVGEWPKTGIPTTVLEIVTWNAINGEAPDEQFVAQFEPRELPTAGLNSVRGHAADGIARVLFREPDRAAELVDSIRVMVTDSSAAVRAMVAEVLVALLNYDRDLAVKLFVELCSDDQVLVAGTIERFLQYGVTTHFSELREVLERAIRSETRNASLIGARQSAVASLFTEDADALVAECRSGNEALRLGVVQVAAANATNSKHRERLKAILLEAFLDSSEEVRSAALAVFAHIKGDELANHIDLLRRYLETPVTERGYHEVFQCLESATTQLPVEAILVCEKLLNEQGEVIANIQMSAASHSEVVTTLAIRVHEQGDDEMRERALDVIDRLVSMGAYHVDRSLDQFER